MEAFARGCPVPAPTLELLVDDQGEFWRVTYAGMCREHRQYWQAYVWYASAAAVYNASTILNPPED